MPRNSSKMTNKNSRRRISKNDSFEDNPLTDYDQESCVQNGNHIHEFLENPRPSKINSITNCLLKDPNEFYKFMKLFHTKSYSNIKKKIIQDVVKNVVRHKKFTEEYIVNVINYSVEEINNTLNEKGMKNSKGEKMEIEWKELLLPVLLENNSMIPFCFSILLELMTCNLKHDACTLLKILGLTMKLSLDRISLQVTDYKFILTICKETIDHLRSNQRLYSTGMKELVLILQVVLFKIKVEESDIEHIIIFMNKIIEKVREASTCISAIVCATKLICESGMQNGDILSSISKRVLDERKTVRISALKSLTAIVTSSRHHDEIIFSKLVEIAPLVLCNLSHLYLYLLSQNVKYDEDSSYTYLETLFMDRRYLGGYDFDSRIIFKGLNSNDAKVSILSARLLVDRMIVANSLRSTFIDKLYEILSIEELDKLRRIIPKVLTVDIRHIIERHISTLQFSGNAVDVMQNIKTIYLFQNIVEMNSSLSEVAFDHLLQCVEIDNNQKFDVLLKSVTSLAQTENSIIKLKLSLEKYIYKYITSDFSVPILLKCYSRNMTNFYKLILKSEVDAVNHPSKFPLFLHGVNIALQVSKEYWRMQAEKKWKLLNNDCTVSSEDYLSEHRKVNDQKEFSGKYIKDMLETGILSRYVALTEEIINHQVFHAIDKKSTEVIICIIKILSTLVTMNQEYTDLCISTLISFVDAHYYRMNRNAEIVVINAFQQLCILMRLIPTSIESKLVTIFENIVAKDISISIKHCIILMMGQLCIEKLINNPSVLMCFTDIMKEEGEMSELAISILMKLLESFEDSSQMALLITQRYFEGMPDDSQKSISKLITLFNNTLKRKNMEEYCRKIIEVFISQPNIQLSEVICQIIPRYEKSCTHFANILISQGFYFFKKLHETSSDCDLISENVLCCVDVISKKYSTMGGFSGRIRNIYNESLKWE